ncbi:MAG: flavodoxin domain-containing protein [Oscillospiraceae bacterium]|nr:flavodoxin domain-containing protein [Oscillospiraceae bacterium]
MNTLILYATKHGAVREIAGRIADSIGGAVLHDLKQGGSPSLAGFDCVIIGSSLYAESIRKEAKAFLAKNADALREKKLGLFLSGMLPDEAEKCFDNNFRKDILQSANAASFLGGIFDPQKAGAFGRILMKAATKQSGYIDTISDEKIAQFAVTMKT